MNKITCIHKSDSLPFYTRHGYRIHFDNAIGHDASNGCNHEPAGTTTVDAIYRHYVRWLPFLAGT